MIRVFLGGAVGIPVMNFMMCFVRPKILDKPYGYYHENRGHEEG